MYTQTSLYACFSRQAGDATTLVHLGARTVIRLGHVFHGSGDRFSMERLGNDLTVSRNDRPALVIKMADNQVIIESVISDKGEVDSAVAREFLEALRMNSSFNKLFLKGNNGEIILSSFGECQDCPIETYQVHNGKLIQQQETVLAP